MTVPKPHPSPKADAGLPWGLIGSRPRYIDELIDGEGWQAMVTAHAWHVASGDPPTRKGNFKLHARRAHALVLKGVRSAMNILAATCFQPQGYQLKIAATELLFNVCVLLSFRRVRWRIPAGAWRV